MRYSYSCFLCGSSVSKPPVSAGKDGKNAHGLHGWGCPKCGKGIKVKRVLKSNSE